MPFAKYISPDVEFCLSSPSKISTYIIIILHPDKKRGNDVGFIRHVVGGFYLLYFFFLNLNADVDMYDSCNVLDTHA